MLARLRRTRGILALGLCWLVRGSLSVTGQWSLTAESGHVSGRESGAANVYVADLSSFVPAGANVYGLRENGNRLIRARYPNANPEFGFGSSLHALSWVPSVLPKEPDVEVRGALCLAS